jgi:hypothetical protein
MQALEELPQELHLGAGELALERLTTTTHGSQVVKRVRAAPARGLDVVEGNVEGQGCPAPVAAGRRLDQAPQVGESIIKVGAVLEGPRPVIVQEPAGTSLQGVGLCL